MNLKSCSMAALLLLCATTIVYAADGSLKVGHEQNTVLESGP